MAETKQQEVRSAEIAVMTPEPSTADPVLTISRGNTTFLIGIHFSSTEKETMDDKIRRLIRRDVENGDL